MFGAIFCDSIFFKEEKKELCVFFPLFSFVLEFLI